MMRNLKTTLLTKAWGWPLASIKRRAEVSSGPSRQDDHSRRGRIANPATPILRPVARMAVTFLAAHAAAMIISVPEKLQHQRNFAKKLSFAPRLRRVPPDSDRLMTATARSRLAEPGILRSTQSACDSPQMAKEGRWSVLPFPAPISSEQILRARGPALPDGRHRRLEPQGPPALWECGDHCPEPARTLWHFAQFFCDVSHTLQGSHHWGPARRCAIGAARMPLFPIAPSAPMWFDSTPLRQVEARSCQALNPKPPAQSLTRPLQEARPARQMP